MSIHCIGGSSYFITIKSSQVSVRGTDNSTNSRQQIPDSQGSLHTTYKDAIKAKKKNEYHTLDFPNTMSIFPFLQIF